MRSLGAMMVLLMTAAACVLGGCAGAPAIPLGPLGFNVGVLPERGAATGAAGSTRRIMADWEDVDAVVDLAVSQAQCGYQEWHHDIDGANRRRWYVLLTMRDESAPLEIRREREGPALTSMGGPAGAPEPIVMTCRVGEFGDANYEKLILDLLEDRFEKLRGDRTAPIADPWGVNQ